MNIAVLMGVFFVLLFLGVPIAYSLCLSAVLYMVLFTDAPVIIIGQRILKGVDSFTLMAMPLLVVAGGLMESGGISKRIVNFARTMVDHLPGRLAIITVVASMIFAAMTGAGTAAAAAVGGIMTPSMQKERYDDGHTSTVQAVGGIFGPLIPPGILVVLCGVASGESVEDMLLIGLVPDLFLGIIVTMVTVWQCIKKRYKGVGHFSLKRATESFLDTIWAILAPAITLGSIYSGLFTLTEVSTVACFYCLIIGLFVYRELNFKSLSEVVFKSAKTTAGIMLIVAATQASGWVLTGAGISQMVAEGFTSVVSSSTVFIFAVVFILIITGCSIDVVPALLTFAPMLVPTATQYGISLTHFDVVMVVTLYIGLVTSPVGISLSVVSSIGGQHIHKIVPYLPVPIASIITETIVIVLIPGISTLLPALMK